MVFIGGSIPKNHRADETKLHSASTSGNSLRTTVPSFIISTLSLEKGDILRWEIKEEGSEKYLKVRCVSGESNE